MTGNTKKRTVLFLAAGSRAIGLGHLSRCNVLADCLSDFNCRFVIEKDAVAESFLKSLGQQFDIVRSIESDAAALVKKYGPCIVVLDRKDNPAGLVERLRESQAAAIVDIEDLGEGRSRADYLIDPHVRPGSEKSVYSGRALTCFGPDWVIVHPVYARLRNRILNARAIEKKAGNINEPSRVLISCGGSDPAGILGRVVKAFEQIDTRKLELTAIMGRAVKPENLKSEKHVLTCLKNVRTLAPHLYGSGLAVVSGGITMLESLCLGVPTVVVPQNEEQKVNSEEFARRGAVIVGPLPEETGYFAKLAGQVKKILEDSDLYLSLASKGINLIDGLGANRVSEIIRNIEF